MLGVPSSDGLDIMKDLLRPLELDEQYIFLFCFSQPLRTIFYQT